jgi:transposase
LIEDRFVITDGAWEKIKDHLPGKESDRGVTGRNNRLFLEAVLWRVRTGCPWRDLPAEFGNSNSIFVRFRRWAKAGVFDRIFELLSGEPDFEYVMIDGTISSVHQKESGERGGLKIKP